MASSSAVVFPCMIPLERQRRKSAGFGRRCERLDFRLKLKSVASSDQSAEKATVSASGATVSASGTAGKQESDEGGAEKKSEAILEKDEAAAAAAALDADEDDLKLERGPSVEEAKQLAKYQGQVEAFAAPYRTKRWALTRNKGAQIADLMIMFGGLMDRGFGSGQIMAASGAVVIDKVKKDAKKLLGEEGVKDQDVYELLRAIQLLEMELQLVKVAKKGEKLFERLEQAKKHCKLAFNIASRI